MTVGFFPVIRDNRGEDQTLGPSQAALEASAPRIGRDLPVAATFSPGDVLAGRFRIVRFIAQGGMGEVHKAEDLELGGRVAWASPTRRSLPAVGASARTGRGGLPGRRERAGRREADTGRAGGSRRRRSRRSGSILVASAPLRSQPHFAKSSPRVDSTVSCALGEMRPRRRMRRDRSTARI